MALLLLQLFKVHTSYIITIFVVNLPGLIKLVIWKRTLLGTGHDHLENHFTILETSLVHVLSIAVPVRFKYVEVFDYLVQHLVELLSHLLIFELGGQEVLLGLQVKFLWQLGKGFLGSLQLLQEILCLDVKIL